MTVVKICGITNLDDALSAVDAGADALGFNFYPPSPRYITPSAARRIIDELPDRILSVGVFVNEDSPETLERLATEAGVTAIQLHGDESPQFCSALRDRYIIKVFAIGENFDARQALSYDVQAIMVDTFDRKARGGTGRTIDWSEARRLRPLVSKLFLAGGLTSENVAEAIALVNPYAVDACSALESSPGKKDSERVHGFVRAVRVVSTSEP